MSVFTWVPQSASKSVVPDVRRIMFGDGYEQRQAAGLNAKRRLWSLSFQKEKSVIAAIDTFLSARGAVESFDWTDPEGVAGKYVCDSWSRSPMLGSDVDSLSATFRQVFEV